MNLYARLLGPRWAALAHPIRAAHATNQILHGRFRVYHEWRARLPARGPAAAPELRLHAARDLFYAILFGTLPTIGWHGRWTLVLVAVIAIEIVLTLWDFVVEIAVRKPFGDVYAGERVMHAIMGIVYGAMVAWLAPVLWDWWSRPTALVFQPAEVPTFLTVTLQLMAAGVFLSGLRDLYAAGGWPHGHWPWAKIDGRNPNNDAC